MNKKRKDVCGIDVSHKTFNACYKGKDRKYTNDRNGWVKLCKETNAEFYAMEATGNYYYKLACYLKSKGFVVLVFNPYRVACFMKSIGLTAKTDKHDARIMIRYSEQKAAWNYEWEKPSPKLARARAIYSLLCSIGKISQASKCVQHSISLVLGKDSDLMEVMPSITVNIEDRMEALQNELCGIMKDVYPQKYRLLQTIPGIGKQTAAALLVVGRGLECFGSSGKLAKFIGIAPTVFESGTSVKGSGKISKAGNPYIRGLLYMCAGNAIRYCRPCVALYQRLTTKGKDNMLAITAVMHRLVKIAFGVVQSGEPFKGGNAVLKMA